MKWFLNCKTQKDVKVQMRKYRKTYHPDKNQQSAFSNRIMAEIQLEYQQVMSLTQALDMTSDMALRPPWDWDEPWVQEARRKFVRRQEILCQSKLVSELLAQIFFHEEDIENYEVQFEILDVHGEFQMVNRQEYKEYMEWLTVAVETNPALEKMLEHSQYSEGQYPQIFEWLAIDEHFANLLREERECILDNDYGLWWGRKCSGQAVCMDGVIHDICVKIGWFQQFYPKKKVA